MTEVNRSDTTLRSGWLVLLRILLKAGLLFVALNALFAACDPLERLGHLSLYKHLLPGRERLPYGEDPSSSYNLSLDNVPAMFASHEVSGDKPKDEFRVLVIGDSATWGWLLEPGQTLAAQLTAAGLVAPDGRRVRAYNAGYPGMSLTKDLLLLDAAMQFEPDLVVWPLTLESFPRNRQLEPRLVEANPVRLRRLIDAYGLGLDPDDARLERRDFLDRTIVGSRRQLADLLRLQLYGFSWAATGVDIDIPATVTPRQSDFEADPGWRQFEGPAALDETILALDAIAAGIARAAPVPVVVVNEPIFVSGGRNSDVRYNSFYPRWAYDSFRALMARVASERGWRYVDAWDWIAPAEFTDTPVHLTPTGMQQFALRLAPLLLLASP
jgi:lysophospholipase L1-like esterase